MSENGLNVRGVSRLETGLKRQLWIASVDSLLDSWRQQRNANISSIDLPALEDMLEELSILNRLGCTLTLSSSSTDSVYSRSWHFSIRQSGVAQCTRCAVDITQGPYFVDRMCRHGNELCYPCLRCVTQRILQESEELVFNHQGNVCADQGTLLYALLHNELHFEDI